MRILLRIFLRWRLGAAKAEELAGWLDVRSRLRTPNFLTEAEVETLYRACRDARQRFLIAVLFDTGGRAEEFHNIRFEDVHYHHAHEATFLTFRLTATRTSDGAPHEEIGIERYTFKDGRIAMKDVYRKSA